MSDPESPAASRTVTVIVYVRGKIVTYVCPLLKDPWLETVPLDVEPSPQLIVYVHGPFGVPSLKLQFRLNRMPVSVV